MSFFALRNKKQLGSAKMPVERRLTSSTATMCTQQSTTNCAQSSITGDEFHFDSLLLSPTSSKEQITMPAAGGLKGRRLLFKSTTNAIDQEDSFQSVSYRSAFSARETDFDLRVVHVSTFDTDNTEEADEREQPESECFFLTNVQLSSSEQAACQQ